MKKRWDDREKLRRARVEEMDRVMGRLFDVTLFGLWVLFIINFYIFWVGK